MFFVNYGRSYRDTFAVTGLKRVSKIRNASERMASFNNFCQFVSEQADLATDPIYSEETVARAKDGDVKFRRSGDRRFKRQKGSSFRTNMSKPDGSTRNPRSRSCALCSKPHDLDECSEFLKKPLTEKRNFVKEKGLCFGCYSSEHIAKLCKSRKSCLTCHKKHPTSIHDHRWKQDGSKTEVEIGVKVKGRRLMRGKMMTKSLMLATLFLMEQKLVMFQSAWA